MAWRYYCLRERCFAGRVTSDFLEAFRRAANHSDALKHPEVGITDDNGHTHRRDGKGRWSPPLRDDLGGGLA